MLCWKFENLPANIENRLNNRCSNETVFKKHKGLYEECLARSGYRVTLKYKGQRATPNPPQRKKRYWESFPENPWQKLPKRNTLAPIFQQAHYSPVLLLYPQHCQLHLKPQQEGDWCRWAVGTWLQLPGCPLPSGWKVSYRRTHLLWNNDHEERELYILRQHRKHLQREVLWPQARFEEWGPSWHNSVQQVLAVKEE